MDTLPSADEDPGYISDTDSIKRGGSCPWCIAISRSKLKKNKEKRKKDKRKLINDTDGEYNALTNALHGDPSNEDAEHEDSSQEETQSQKSLMQTSQETKEQVHSENEIPSGNDEELFPSRGFHVENVENLYIDAREFVSKQHSTMISVNSSENARQSHSDEPERVASESAVSNEERQSTASTNSVYRDANFEFACSEPDLTNDENRDDSSGDKHFYENIESVPGGQRQSLSKRLSGILRRFSGPDWWRSVVQNNGEMVSNHVMTPSLTHVLHQENTSL